MLLNREGISLQILANTVCDDDDDEPVKYTSLQLLQPENPKHDVKKEKSRSPSVVALLLYSNLLWFSTSDTFFF